GLDLDVANRDVMAARAAHPRIVAVGAAPQLADLDILDQHVMRMRRGDLVLLPQLPHGGHLLVFCADFSHGSPVHAASDLGLFRIQDVDIADYAVARLGHQLDAGTFNRLINREVLDRPVGYFCEVARLGDGAPFAICSSHAYGAVPDCLASHGRSDQSFA